MCVEALLIKATNLVAADRLQETKLQYPIWQSAYDAIKAKHNGS